jgi:hypothetical protein
VIRPENNLKTSAKGTSLRWLTLFLAFTAARLFAQVSVPLAWNPSPDANVAGYTIYYGGASGSYTNSIEAGDVTSTVISGLSANTTYFFAAKTLDSDGVESAFSNEATFTTGSGSATGQTNQNQTFPPALNAINNLTVAENSGAQNIALTGISAGSGAGVSITAVSGNPALIANPAVNYASPDATGTLVFAPVTNMTGTAVITVTVDNGQAQSNLVTQSFTVTVLATNEAPTLDPLADVTLGIGSAAQVVALTGISPGAVPQTASTQKSAQVKVKVTAKSSNTKLVRAPKVVYASPDSAGTLTFKPAAKASGTAVITVTVTVSRGNKKTSTSQKFTVTVLPQTAVASVAAKTSVKVSVGTPAAPAVLESAGLVDGHFSFTVTGTAGSNYVVQASSDLANWTPVQTNAAPFAFTDLNSSAADKKFYRAASL